MSTCINCNNKSLTQCSGTLLLFCKQGCQRQFWDQNTNFCNYLTTINGKRKADNIDDQKGKKKQLLDFNLLEKLVEKQKDVAKIIFMRLPLKDFLNVCKSSNVISNFCVKRGVYKHFYSQNNILTILVLLNKLESTKVYSDFLSLHTDRMDNVEYLASQLELHWINLFVYKRNETEYFMRYLHDVDAVRLILLYTNVNPSSYKNRAIRTTCTYGYTEVVKLLLADDRVDPSASDTIALMMASQNGHTEVVKLLVSDPRIDPSYRSNTALYRALRENHYKIVKILLENEKTVLKNTNAVNNALYMAMANKQSELLKVLLSSEKITKLLDNKKYYDIETFSLY